MEADDVSMLKQLEKNLLRLQLSGIAGISKVSRFCHRCCCRLGSLRYHRGKMCETLVSLKRVKVFGRQRTRDKCLFGGGWCTNRPHFRKVCHWFVPSFSSSSLIPPCCSSALSLFSPLPPLPHFQGVHVRSDEAEVRRDQRLRAKTQGMGARNRRHQPHGCPLRRADRPSTHGVERRC